MIATSIPVAGAATGHRNALCVAHIAAVLFGLTGILGHLIDADASIITFGRATFAFIALASSPGSRAPACSMRSLCAICRCWA